MGKGKGGGCSRALGEVYPSNVSIVCGSSKGDPDPSEYAIKQLKKETRFPLKPQLRQRGAGGRGMSAPLAAGSFRAGGRGNVRPFSYRAVRSYKIIPGE